MIVLDTSGWLEVLKEGPRAQTFLQRLEQADHVLVPTVTVYEVYKVARRELSEEAANLAAGRLRRHEIGPCLSTWRSKPPTSVLRTICPWPTP